MQIQSKLASEGLTIFTIMSALAKEHKAINLGQGFPDYDCSPELRERVSKYLNEGKNQYCPMPGLLELRKAICNKISRSYDLDLNPETQVCVTAGGTQALFTAIEAFVHPGDEVIVMEPAYDSYIPSIQIAGGVAISYAMKYPDYKIDWNHVASLITDKTRMIMINTPHNPTGTILEKEDLEALELLVTKHDLILLSDEVYEHLIYDEAQHESVLRFPQLFERSLAVYSFGKTFHTTGWKMGYIVGPEYLMKEFKNIHQWNVFSVNSFLQYALAEHLQYPVHYESLPAFFQKKRDYLTEALVDSPLKAMSSKGTYFQLYDYTGISDLNDLEFAKYLTREVGVAAIPLSPFYKESIEAKVVRLCFAKKLETLDQAAERLNKL